MSEIDERPALIARATELKCFEHPELMENWRLRDAIAAEEACMGWEEKFNQLPTDAAKQDAIHRLRLSLWPD